MVYAVVTGGGTSGHVLPALAICELLADSGHALRDIRYVGTRRGVDKELMSQSGVVSEFLPISGLQRSWNLRSLARNIVLPLRLARSRILARRLIRKWKPSVVISVGGYASEPMSRAAIASGVPLVCVSYDRIAGLATRRQARHAAVCAVAFEGSALPSAVVTGAPVRRDLRTVDVVASRSNARRALGIPLDAHVVVMMGGSLGSASLNSAVADLLAALTGTSSVMYHICGRRFERDPMPHVPIGVQYIRVGYEENMTDVYSSLDLLVARAGASTVAEIATVGVASILVPWPDAADNHQELNARWLSDAAASILMDDQSCLDGRLVAEVVSLLGNSEKLIAMSRTARILGALHRGQALTGVIEGAARQGVERETMGS
jgi:UDP-N-acetylglucosamine--N-acetylmuramyl-(pentapeptide) pyrophosphoryl-undecaprenol N-acetylglucosamine transferase